ncbi:Uncharacterised protein [Legionella wadsworthii]|uniref:Transposase n=1 Tax=Legionella wadsworthii TaxID=28088 RepID=A0A378LMZ6_9GAMM|nr:hypothetical protein [Legionella wadsworthii]STY28286.1 Uncharacterised protein [Legionella wadsworthii]
MQGYNLLDMLQDLIHFIWYQKNKSWAPHLCPLLFSWYDQFFLNVPQLQELAKDRNLSLTQDDFYELKHLYYTKGWKKLSIKKEDLSAILQIKKIENKTKGQWLYLSVDPNEKVHDFYLGFHEADASEFLKHSLASNGLPPKLNTFMAEKDKLIKTTLDTVRNSPDLDIY